MFALEKGKKLSDHTKNRVHFGLTDGRGTMGRKGLRGLIIQIKSSHFEGVHFFRSSCSCSASLPFCMNLLDYLLFHGRLVD